MKLQTIPLVQRQKTLFHLLLVVGILLYLYSPLLDHWAGNETYARPHTHIEVTSIVLQHQLTDETTHSSENGEHQDGIFCMLDISVLFSVVVYINAPSNCPVQNIPLMFNLLPSYQQVSTIYFSSLDPPPRI